VSDDSGYPLDDPKHPVNAGASKGLRESLATGLRRGDRVRDVKSGRIGSVIHQQKSNWQDGTLVMVRLDGDDPTVNPDQVGSRPRPDRQEPGQAGTEGLTAAVIVLFAVLLVLIAWRSRG